MMQYRPAKEKDLLEFMDDVPCSCRAWAAVDGEEVYGIGGVYYLKGRIVAFSHMRPDMPKRDRIKGARIIMNIVKEMGAPVYAYPATYESAPRTLEHFGFERIPGSDWHIWRAAS